MKITFKFKVLIVQDKDLWIATCLDLDIVTTSYNKEKVISDIKSLIQTQLNYCLEFENFDYLLNRTPRIIQSYYEQLPTAEYLDLIYHILGKKIICYESLHDDNI